MASSIKDWIEQSRELVFKKYSRAIEKVDFELPSGKISDFYIKSEDQVICTLAITSDNLVILARQFRPGPQKILNELPGGRMEKDETPIQAAARELLEETGYQGKMEHVTTAFDCAYSTQIRHCFVATDCIKVKDQQLDEDEFAEVVLLPLNEFRDLLRSGQMTDVEVGYLGLDHLGLL